MKIEKNEIDKSKDRKALYRELSFGANHFEINAQALVQNKIQFCHLHKHSTLFKSGF
jgi:hypothetical protein